jgi:hypothetical protein
LYFILDTRIPEQSISRKVFYRFFYFFNKIKLSITMTKHLSSVKEGLQSYCNKVYSRSSFNTMWILIYSYDLLDHFNSRFNSWEVHLSKKWPQQFTHHSSWKCINTFKEICKLVNYKRVTYVTNLYFFLSEARKNTKFATQKMVSALRLSSISIIYL